MTKANQAELIKKIKAAARRDEELRRDPRYLETMGFLVAKGFLRTNQPILPLPNKRIAIDDAIWAGRNVEPRILEVLPAAVIRLAKHFDFDPLKHPELARVLDQMRHREEKGDDFCGVPYAKCLPWLELPLQDGRTKTVSEKRIMKTFRLSLETVKRLKELSQEWECTETEVLEKRLLR